MDKTQEELKFYHTYSTNYEFAIKEFTYLDNTIKFQPMKREISTAVLSDNTIVESSLRYWRDLGHLCDSIEEAQEKITNFKKRHFYPTSERIIEIK